VEGKRRRKAPSAQALQAPGPGGVCQVEPSVSTASQLTKIIDRIVGKRIAAHKLVMRDDHANHAAGWDSVDTVIRDESHSSPRQSLRVVSFSNGIEPATIPTGILVLEPDPEPDEVAPLPAASAQRFAQSSGFEMPA